MQVTPFLKTLLIGAIALQASAATAGVPLLPGSGLDIKFPPPQTVMPSIGAVWIHPPFSAPFSPDGRFLFAGTQRTPSPATAASGYGFHINKIDTATGQVVGDIPIDTSFPQNKIKSIIGNFSISSHAALAAGKSRLAIALMQDSDGISEAGLVRAVLTDLNGKPVKAFNPVKAKGVVSLMLSPDERYLVLEAARSAGEGGDFVDEIRSEQFCVLHVWDTASGKQVAEIPSPQLHPNSKNQCSLVGEPYYTVSGTQLTFPRFFPETTDEYGDDDETAKLEQAWLGAPKVYSYDWAAKSLQPLGAESWHSMAPIVTAPSGDGRSLLMTAWPAEGSEQSGKEYPRLFSLPGMEEKQTLDISNPVDATMLTFTWSPDQQQLLMVGVNDSAILFAMHYDLASNRQLSFHELPIRTNPGLHSEGWDAAKGRFVVMGHARQGSGVKLFWI